MSSHDPIDAAHAAALDRWATPFPGFASGHDRRTSDEGLLTLMYGGLEHAARYDWQNAGRRLIDKTYVDMLWHVQGLTKLRSVRAEQIAAALDSFITDVVKPAWADLPHLSDDHRLKSSIAWTEHMAEHCFGSVYNETAASRLMFYLFPMLPVFNLDQGRQMALEELGHRPVQQSYRAFAQAAVSAYRELLPSLARLRPPATSASDTQNNLSITGLLAQTDWWARRVFDEYLRGLISYDDANDMELFGIGDFDMPTR